MSRLCDYYHQMIPDLEQLHVLRALTSDCLNMCTNPTLSRCMIPLEFGKSIKPENVLQYIYYILAIMQLYWKRSLWISTTRSMFSRKFGTRLQPVRKSCGKTASLWHVHCTCIMMHMRCNLICACGFKFKPQNIGRAVTAVVILAGKRQLIETGVTRGLD